MFERFTDKARTAVIAARAEASEHGDQIRPVYLLHALAAGEGVAARALAGLGVDTGVIERKLDCAAPLRRPAGGEDAGEDAEALASIGIDLDEIRRRVEESFGPGGSPAAGAPAWPAAGRRDGTAPDGAPAPGAAPGTPPHPWNEPGLIAWQRWSPVPPVRTA